MATNLSLIIFLKNLRRVSPEVNRFEYLKKEEGEREREELSSNREKQILRVEQFHFFQSGDPLLSRNKKKKERKKGKERLGIYKFPARISSTVFLPSEIVFRARSRWKQLRFYPKWTTRSRATIQYPRMSDQKVHTTRLKKCFQYLKRGGEG